jgi:RNAse (barnase) inhibitor barstar
MNPAQKVMLRDFNIQFFNLTEKYWNPSDSDAYWDALTDDAMELISKFQTSDAKLNNYIQSIVATFLNSREDMLA